MLQAALALCVSLLTQLPAQPPSLEDRVRGFIKAFNERNIDAMLAAADDGIEWLSVDGQKISAETQGKAALKTSMESYFKSCPSCRSELVWMQRAGSRIAAHEKASFTNRAGVASSQAGLSVYEFKDGRILRVYYFPVER